MKIDLFSAPIFIGNIDLNKLNFIFGKGKNKFESQVCSTYGTKTEIDINSYIYLMETISKLIIKHYSFSGTLELQDIWMNQYKKDDFQEKHIHVGSTFSFIIYVEGESSKTMFFSPSKYLLESFYGEDLFPLVHEVECRKGQIVVFPSHLEHMVKKNNNSVTYAGNLKLTDYTFNCLKYKNIQNDNN